jgi:hypothetical protein
MEGVGRSSSVPFGWMVVLNDDRRTGLLNFVPDCRIEGDQPDFTAPG